MMQPELQIRPLRGAIPLGEVSNLDLLVRIVPPQLDVARPAARSSLNLALVLDRSGSMSGGKMELAREAACNLVAQLGPNDRVSVVAFDEHVEVAVPSTPVQDVQAVQAIIRGIHSRGSTALHQGWVEGGLQVSQHLDAQAVNRVILLTDGQANVGERRPEVLAAQAGELAARGVSTTTMGVGDDYEETLLTAMAEQGDGSFYHLEGPAQFETFFGLELEGLSRLVGRRVSLGLEPARGVRARIRNHLAPTGTGRFRLPNLLSGVPCDLVVGVTLEGPTSEGETPLLRFLLAWDPLEGKRQVLRQAFSMPAVSRARLSEFPDDPEVFEIAALVEIARLKRKATEKLREGQVERAREYLQRAQELAFRLPPSRGVELERMDLAHLQAYVDHGQMESARRAAHFQERQRSHGRSDFSSGRETRMNEY